jgi:peptide methionine sulfoxide reductase msrA/msrB
MLGQQLPENPNLQVDYSARALHKIYLAGGCFWGTQAYLDRVPGVAATSVGYANGRTIKPSYQNVCTNNTGYAETVEVSYDPAVLSLQDLLKQFSQIIDPTMLNRQGNDKGTQYRSGIYYTDTQDVPVIEAVLREEQLRYKLPIVTEVKPLERYDQAEDYHQAYLEKNPGGYCHVSFKTLPKGPIHLPSVNAPVIDPSRFTPIIDPSRFPRPEAAKLKKKLSPLQFAVACESATEHPFSR